MLTRDRAADVVERVVARRPIRRSSPWPMLAPCTVLGMIMQCRVLVG